MPSNIRNCIPGQQRAHKAGKTGLGTAKKDVGVIGHQCPGINDSFGAAGKLSQTINKIFAARNIIDDPALLDTSHNNMM